MNAIEESRVRPGTIERRIASPSFQYLLQHSSGRAGRKKTICCVILGLLILVITISVGLALKFTVLRDANLDSPNGSNIYENITTIGQIGDILALVGGKYGDGTSSRDYTYIDDIVSGVAASLDNKKEIKCEVYNLGNSSPVSLNEFIALCEKVAEKKALFEQIEDQLGDVPHTYADISKAKRDLEYEPKVCLEKGLKINPHLSGAIMNLNFSKKKLKESMT